MHPPSVGSDRRAVWLGLAVAASICCCVAAVEVQCQTLADTYLTKHHREPVPYTGSNMVYFLHVPRTAGRTFHSCFLKTGTPPKRRCPKAYDHLRINVSIPNCYLLSSHDDFSVVAMLPEDVAVLSHIRDPVDRFLSAYEFAVEVAARIKKKPANFRKNPNKIATEDVWPWSYLVPFFAADQLQRVCDRGGAPSMHACMHAGQIAPAGRASMEQWGCRLGEDEVRGGGSWQAYGSDPDSPAPAAAAQAEKKWAASHPAEGVCMGGRGRGAASWCQQGSAIVHCNTIGLSAPQPRVHHPSLPMRPPQPCTPPSPPPLHLTGNWIHVKHPDGDEFYHNKVWNYVGSGRGVA